MRQEQQAEPVAIPIKSSGTVISSILQTVPTASNVVAEPGEPFQTGWSLPSSLRESSIGSEGLPISRWQSAPPVPSLLLDYTGSDGSDIVRRFSAPELEGANSAVSIAEQADRNIG
jgi:hypothetical protein